MALQSIRHDLTTTTTTADAITTLHRTIPGQRHDRFEPHIEPHILGEPDGDDGDVPISLYQKMLSATYGSLITSLLGENHNQHPPSSLTPCISMAICANSFTKSLPLMLFACAYSPNLPLISLLIGLPHFPQPHPVATRSPISPQISAYPHAAERSSGSPTTANTVSPHPPSQPPYPILESNPQHHVLPRKLKRKPSPRHLMD
jgi:hypothetical protein